MMIDRRVPLATVPSLLAGSARIEDEPTVPATYERDTGGRCLYALNTSDGATIAWRADERFVMCGTF